MAGDNADDAFADFEDKIASKPKKKTKFFKKREKESYSEEDDIKKKYKDEQDAIKEKYRKEMAALQAKKTKDAIREGKMHPNQHKIERIAFIAVIVILLAYIVIDLSFYHGSDVTISESSDDVNAAAAGSSDGEDETESEKEEAEDKIEVTKVTEEEEEKEAEEKKEEEKKTPTPKRSGRVEFVINDIDYEVVDDDLGYIRSVKFTIQNDKDLTITPFVQVFAYDEELEDTWIDRARGEYTHSAGISPGKYVEGSIDLVPKTFRNLNLEKTVRLELNDTKTGFLKAVSDEIEID